MKKHYYNLDINSKINWKSNLKYSGLLSSNFYADRGFLREVGSANWFNQIIK